MDEVASLTLTAPQPLRAVSQALRALDSAGVLERPLSCEPDQLDELLSSELSDEQRELVETLGTEPPLESVCAALEGLQGAGDGEPRLLFVYFRLLAPEALPADWRAAYAALLGTPPGTPDLWVVHPYESWLCVDLSDPSGARRSKAVGAEPSAAAQHYPAGVKLLSGQRSRPAGLELRTLVENSQYLAFALARVGALAHGALLEIE